MPRMYLPDEAAQRVYESMVQSVRDNPNAGFPFDTSQYHAQEGYFAEAGYGVCCDAFGIRAVPSCLRTRKNVQRDLTKHVYGPLGIKLDPFFHDFDLSFLTELGRLVYGKNIEVGFAVAIFDNE